MFCNLPKEQSWLNTTLLPMCCYHKRCAEHILATWVSKYVYLDDMNHRFPDNLEGYISSFSQQQFNGVPISPHARHSRY